jgi:hypothetical protein
VEGRLDLVRDLIDKLVLDRYGREMGRVDGVILEIGGDEAPRVAAIAIGSSVLARRVRPFLGRWAAGLERALGIDEGRPLRIPFAAVLDVTNHVRVDVAVGETPGAVVEHALRNVWSALPGGSS